MIEFENVNFLYFLLLVPLLGFYWSRKRSGGGIVFSSVENIRKAMGVAKAKGKFILNILRMLSLAAFIIALARPRSVIEETKIPVETIDVLIVLDISTSMTLPDLEENNTYVSRMDVAKKVLSEFIGNRSADRMGLVIFSRYAFSVCPSTLDHTYLLERIRAVQPGMIEDGTAIGSAIGTAVNKLKKSDAKSKLIILITDGANNIFTIDPLDAANIARKYGVKVYTIGVGSKGDKAIPVGRDLFGEVVYSKVAAELDDELLNKISEKTGGLYFRATDANSLKGIFEKIDELERSEIKQKFYMQYKEFYPYCLIAGLAILFLYLIFVNTVFRKLP
ncbi:VWA domain-containing protein [bacterium]|jgi:Ca-activated chloride channel family protein|nr:VWA domain-containing protein [bacterium]